MSEATRELAMFPLGSVLFPGMPLPLWVFEPRYVAMLSSVLGETEREFGVALIERGSEVGGGDVRFGVGTVARIASVEITEGSIVLLATGAARFEVVRWLAEDPFPRAQVRELDALELDTPTVSALVAAEALVRATIARASEFVELPGGRDAGGGRPLHRQVGRRQAGRRRLPSVTLAASGTADSAAVAGSGSHPAPEPDRSGVPAGDSLGG